MKSAAMKSAAMPITAMTSAAMPSTAMPSTAVKRAATIGSRATLALLAVLTIAPRASADPRSEARPHIERASSLHAAGKYAEALKALTLAYALDPQPQLLYAIAQVHVKLGDCEGATTFYQRFLATNPEARQASVARQAIARCTLQAPPPERTVELKPAPPPSPAPARVEPDDDDEPAPPPPRPRGTDWIGWSLFAGGVAAGAAGGYFYWSALGTIDDANRSTTYDRHGDGVRDAQTQAKISYALFGGAGLLVGAGLIHVLLHDGGTEHAVAVLPERGGVLATWAARF
jgi:tetratricopeptide (TPR) repeat protein